MKFLISGEFPVDSVRQINYNVRAIVRGVPMKLDLRTIIEVPGGRVPFAHTLETERLDFPQVTAYTAPITAQGEVKNTAGILELTGSLHCEMRCICDRCGTEFERVKELPLKATLTADPEGSDDPELFPLEGDALDLDDVLETLFVLDMESKFLCREDCKGLCEQCGANLNDGPCGCKKPIDPRLAVLEQLLDKKDD